MSQTYVFTVAVTGDDVQDQADELREQVIGLYDSDTLDVHVTPSVRVTP